MRKTACRLFAMALAPSAAVGERSRPASSSGFADGPLEERLREPRQRER